MHKRQGFLNGGAKTLELVFNDFCLAPLILTLMRALSMAACVSRAAFG